MYLLNLYGNVNLVCVVESFVWVLKLLLKLVGFKVLKLLGL